MMEYIKQRMVDDEEKLIKLERQINPLLDDNDQNQLSFTLQTFLEKFSFIESKYNFEIFVIDIAVEYVGRALYLFDLHRENSAFCIV
jgi:hypothetical protein